MDKKTQDFAWASLPKEVRDFIKSNTATAWQLAYARLFGEHNLTSDTEPEEMLMVSRSEVQDRFNTFNNPNWASNEEETYGAQLVIDTLDSLFGDKCLPDKENTPKSGELKSDKATCKENLQVEQPSDQVEPKFKIGSKVIVLGGVANKDMEGKMAFVTGLPKGNSNKFIVTFGNGLWTELSEEYLEPYTEPIAQNPAENSNTGSLSSKSESMEEGEEEDAKKIVENTISIAKEYFDNVKINKDNMEEKELNLCELLKGCEEMEIFSLIEEEVKIRKIDPFCEEPAIETNYSYKPNGCFYGGTERICLLYPSRSLYEKYPLDAYSAWMEWKEARKPKYEVRCIIEYWEVGTSSKYTAPYNIIVSSKEEAQQAADGVREYLLNFHEKISEK